MPRKIQADQAAIRIVMSKSTIIALKTEAVQRTLTTGEVVEGHLHAAWTKRGKKTK